ncbi:DUF2079 domain-containing protein [Leptolyngbya sp. FACHB-261]|nr:DUF2079 domain-containing protein [Leptolyngbya sp. FACHB-261]
MLGRFKLDGPQRWLWGISAAFCIYILLFELNRHFTFYTSFDQGIFNQVFWNSLHGRWFQSSLSSTESALVEQLGQAPDVAYRRLGQHFTPTLLLWLPVYGLFSSLLSGPVVLIFLQTLLITAGGLALYRLAQHYLTQPWLPLWITASYFAAIAVIGPAFSNFHDISQTPLCFFLLVLCAEHRKWRWFWLLFALGLGIREDAGVGLFGLGLYLLVSRKAPSVGLTACGLSVAYVLGVSSVIMPLFSPDISDRFMQERFGQYVGKGGSSLDVLLAFVTRPWLVLQELVTPVDKTLTYLLGQWLPLAFVPSLSGAAWLMAGPPLFKLFVAKGQTVLSLNVRYAMSVVPPLFYGAILWWQQHPERFTQRRFRRFWAFCIGFSFLLGSIFASVPHRVFYFLLPDSFSPWVYVSLPRQWSHVVQMRPLLAQIPPDASVSSTTYLVPQVSSRRAVVRLPGGIQYKDDAGQTQLVDYAVLDMFQIERYAPAFSYERGCLPLFLDQIDQMLGSGYGLVSFADGGVLLQRGVPSNPEALAQWRPEAQRLRQLHQRLEA